MNTKFRKWKFKPMKKVFISEKRLGKLISKKKITIFDTRNQIDFKKKKIITSKRVSPNSIKRVMLEQGSRDYILLVGKELRTNAGVASWARYQGFKHVYLLNKNIRDIKNKKIANYKHGGNNSTH